MSNSEPNSDTAPDPRADGVRDSLRGDAGDNRRHPAEDSLGRDFTDGDRERIDVLVAMEMETILPTPPKIPGVHWCWLADSQYDSLARRERAGYRPATKQMLGTWSCGASRTAKDDLYRVNEMILYYLPEHAWTKYMQTAHHQRPLELESRIKVNVDLLAGRVRESNFGRVIENGSIGPDSRPMPTSFQAA